MVITGIVVIGGVKRLGSFTEKLVPFMATIYIVASIAFQEVAGAFGGYIVSFSLILFVFSTLCVLIWYGENLQM
ncbi:alanine:cation symporter family protein [Anaerotignum sp.]|uniref:alanine:cation symporter family protein n=1 Tax=Anaerotignum sp. TaxID=2039241 RepID=UPI002714B3B7|nr:alanine:cation symporter family protein [Anaerotignum sp.]